MKKSYRILVAVARLAAFALLCSPQSVKATSLGSPVPKPTAINQYPVSAPYAGGFVWTPVTLPWLTNGSQSAFGGSIDTTSRLSVNPQGTTENGLKINTPSGSTGSPLVVQNNGVTTWSLDNSGRITVAPGQQFTLRNSTGTDILYVSNAYLHFPNAAPVFDNGYIQLSGGGLQVQGGGGALSGLFTFGYGQPININNTVATLGFANPNSVPLTLKSQSAQTADFLDFNDSTNAVKAKVDSAFKATFPVVNATTAFQANGTPGLTTTLADGSTITGGIITGVPTLVGADTQTLRYNGTALTATSNQLTNTAGQTAFGGAIDTTSRVSVNPQGTGENGLTVTMPSGATGNALTTKQSGSTLFATGVNGITSINSASTAAQLFVNVSSPSLPGLIIKEASGQFGKLIDFQNSTGVSLSNVDSGGNWSIPGGGVGAGYAVSANGNSGVSQKRIAITYDSMFASQFPAVVFGNTDTEIIRLNPGEITLTGNNVYGGVSGTKVIIRRMASQSMNLTEWNTEAGANLAAVSPSGVMTAKGFASSVRVVTVADTATLSDSVLLCNGTFTQTLPATGWPTGYRLTVKDTGTGTITLTAGGTVTFDGATTITFATQYKSRVFIFDGVNFAIESGYL